MRRCAGIVLIMLLCLVLASVELVASELVGIYALVDKVIFEPNEQSPQRIQIWGVIATGRDLANPKRGYLYFRLPAGFHQEANDAAQKEWADLKAVAGTQQPIAFGRRFFPFEQQTQADAYVKSMGRVRPASEKPSDPEPYPVNIGISKLTDASILSSLRKVAK